jgi:hypothetical protein
MDRSKPSFFKMSSEREANKRSVSVPLESMHVVEEFSTLRLKVQNGQNGGLKSDVIHPSMPATWVHF